MKTKAVRLYGEMDLRLDEFNLPNLGEDEILLKIQSDSLCMSSYKAAVQGNRHKRVPENIAEHPIIIGHEFCGTIVQVGRKWQHQYRENENVTIQPALQETMLSAGYSFEHIGGEATYVIIPDLYLSAGCLLKFDGNAFFYGSLAEPMSCIIGAFHAQYHTKRMSYAHQMGIVPGGKMAILGGAGPMGLGAIDYAVNGPVQPSLLVVTDVDRARLERAERIYSPDKAAQKGVRLIYINSSEKNAIDQLHTLDGRQGYDDVFCMTPIQAVVEQADALLGWDGCLNFFAGPIDQHFSVPLNFYNVHYSSTHIVGTSGGSTQDMREALALMASYQINPAGMVTHIGGLDSAAQATLELPKIPGGKKLIYTHLKMPLTAIEDFKRLGQDNPLFSELANITEKNDGLWCAEAEHYLLAHGTQI